MSNIFGSKHTTFAIAPITIIQTIAILFVLYFLYLIMDILILTFLAFILMIALSPISRNLQRYLKLPRVASIVGTYIIFIGILVLFFAILLPPLGTELAGLAKYVNLPIVAAMQEELLQFKFSLTEIGNFAARLGTSVSMIFSILTSTFSGIFTTFTLLVMSFFMLQDREHLYKKIRWFTQKEEHLTKTRDFIDDLERELGGWVRGELILMLVIGTLTYIGLMALSVPYALPLAILAGALEILPNIGPTIAAVPAIVIAFLATQNPVVAGAVLILNIVIQQLENNVIVPKVMKDNANVSPLVSIVSILIGVKLGGIIGALLAVPIYIMIRTVYTNFFAPRTEKLLSSNKN